MDLCIREIAKKRSSGVGLFDDYMMSQQRRPAEGQGWSTAGGEKQSAWNKR